MFNVNKKAIATLVFAGLGAAAISGQAIAANSTATSTARIYQAMTIGAASTNIDFGILTPTGTAGNVTVNGDHSLNVGTAATATAGTPSAATFAITGLANTVYTIDTATGSSDLTGPATMTTTYTAYSFNTDNTYATSGATATLSGAGGDTLRVGATIAVGATQTAGVYTGTASVTVDYQ